MKRLRRRWAVPCGALALCACAAAGETDTPLPPEPGIPLVETAPAADDDLTPSILLDDLEATSREKQARMERLRRQLLQLAESRRRVVEPDNLPINPELSDDEPATIAPELVAPPPAHDAHAVPPPVDVNPHATEPATDEHAEPAPLPHGDPHAAHGAGAHDAHAPAEAIEALPGAKINRLALADSLFASGQSDLALQTYSSIEMKKLTAGDRYWIEYQIANCHRRLGNTSEAEQRYRRVAGLVDGGWCAAHARWWLDSMSKRASLQRELDHIKGSLRAMEEQLDAKSKP